MFSLFSGWWCCEGVVMEECVQCLCLDHLEDAFPSLDVVSRCLVKQGFLEQRAFRPVTMQTTFSQHFSIGYNTIMVNVIYKSLIFSLIFGNYHHKISRFDRKKHTQKKSWNPGGTENKLTYHSGRRKRRCSNLVLILKGGLTAISLFLC